MNDIKPSALKDIYVSMLRIRLFEERVAELITAGEITCPCHLYIGQEAIATGVCSALEKEDYVWGGHRSHGHYLAKGGDMQALMAEMYGKTTGCSKGRGGSMHLFAPEVGILGTVPIVAATIPIAVGSALASVMQGTGRVAVAFFGDGAVEEGQFHESLNFAALKKLPVVFVCENNLFSSHLRLSERQPTDNIYKSGEAHGMPGVQLDGNNVVEVFHAATEAIQRARSGQGPTLLECRTYRWRGHVGPNWDLGIGIREQDEVDYWVERCPVAALETRLIEQGTLSPNGVAQTKEQIQREVAAAVLFAQTSPFPGEIELTEHVFGE